MPALCIPAMRDNRLSCGVARDVEGEFIALERVFVKIPWNDKRIPGSGTFRSRFCPRAPARRWRCFRARHLRNAPNGQFLDRDPPEADKNCTHHVTLLLLQPPHPDAGRGGSGIGTGFALAGMRAASPHSRRTAAYAGGICFPWTAGGKTLPPRLNQTTKEERMGIISWIIFGLIAGAIAKFILPGRVDTGIIMTSLLGIVGAIIGGFAGSMLGFGPVTGFNLPSFFTAVIGALLFLLVYGKLKAR